MAPPITSYVDISVLVEGAQSEVLNFGTIMFATNHDNTSARLMGPYRKTADLTAAGFDSEDQPEIYNAAATVWGQDNGVKEFYVGRIDDGDADITESLDAIEAAGQDLFFGVMVDTVVDSVILLAMAWVEQRNNDSIKFGFFKSNADSLLNGHGPVHIATVGGTPADGTYRVIFTGFGLDPSPVNVDVVRATTPATNADIAAAMVTAIDDLIATTLEGVVASVELSGTAGVAITLARDLATGTVTTSDPGAGPTFAVTNEDTDIYSRAHAGGYTQSGLIYTPAATGTEAYKDAGALSRLLGFKMDSPGGMGVLAYKQLKITPFTPLDPDQAEAIETYANYHGRKLGLAFVWPGVTPAGVPYFCDVKVSTLWFIRRSQEAILTLQVGQVTKIGYNRGGILKCVNAVMGVLKNGGRNGHFLTDDENPGFGPRIEIPKLENVSGTDKRTRVLNLTSTLNRMTADGAIQKIVVVMRLSFGPDDS
jgi:hypothetical protein